MDDARDAEKNAQPADAPAQAPADPVIESASATTSPDNARSGGAAYVVFAIVAALLLVVVSGLSSCTGAVADLAWRNTDGRSRSFSYVMDPYGHDYDIDYDYDLDDWIDLLDELELHGQDTTYLFSGARGAR